MCNHSSNNIHIQTPGSIFLLIHINSGRQADGRLKVVLGPGAITHCVSLKPSADAVCAQRSERGDGLLVYKSVSCMRQRHISGRALLSGSFSLETRGEKWPERDDESPSPPLWSSDTKCKKKTLLVRQNNTAHTNASGSEEIKPAERHKPRARKLQTIPVVLNSADNETPWRRQLLERRSGSGFRSGGQLMCNYTFSHTHNASLF